MDLPLKGRAVQLGGRKVCRSFLTVRWLWSRPMRASKATARVCPLGPVYLPAYAVGVRAGTGEIAPHLIGLDPANLTRVNDVMDAALSGHPYAKSPIDIACWDILGKSLDAPVCDLLGGVQGESVALYRAISQLPADEMAANVASYREAGYRKFQLKVGAEAKADIMRIHAVRSILNEDEILVADANRGWQAHDALRVVNSVAGLDVYIEQPCRSYTDSLAVRRHTNLPFILDESIDSLAVSVAPLFKTARWMR